MELIPVEAELGPTGTVDTTEFTWGDGAEGTEGFPEEVRETELLTLDTGTLLLFILLETCSMEFTMGLESGNTKGKKSCQIGCNDLGRLGGNIPKLQTGVAQDLTTTMHKKQRAAALKLPPYISAKWKTRQLNPPTATPSPNPPFFAEHHKICVLYQPVLPCTPHIHIRKATVPKNCVHNI